eukprot:11195800-Lingulodinium_polyedra.AAC.1
MVCRAFRSPAGSGAFHAYRCQLYIDVCAGTCRCIWMVGRASENSAETVPVLLTDAMSFGRKRWPSYSRMP